MSTTDTFKLVVLVSGDGSNLQAIIDATKIGELAAEVVAVISNNEGVRALTRADQASIPAVAIAHRNFPNRADFDAALADEITRYQPDLIVLAGFMRILTPGFIAQFNDRIVNIHPSLLPLHPGLNTHSAALNAGDKEHGTTVHYVTETLDDGPLVGQAKFKVGNNDNELSLKNRVQRLEHRLYPACLQLIASKQLEYREGQVYFHGEACSSPPLLMDER